MINPDPREDVGWVEEKKKKEYARVHKGERTTVTDRSVEGGERESAKESTRVKAGFSSSSILKIAKGQYPG